MIRRALVGVALAALLAVSCKNASTTAGPDGGPPPKKIYCKVNNQCWVCADEAALKKCILNPITSGCTQSTDCP